MRYIESTSTDPYYNLALEEFVFERLPRDDSYFMLWQNEKTIVIGKYQNAPEEVNQDYVDKHGIRVARRLSGGGAVYHDMGNLNFTFVVDQDDLEKINFTRFCLPIIETLAELGVKAEFTGRNDLVIDGCKFSGNSQYLKKGRVMHHGCIMLDSSLGTVSEALKVRAAKFASKNVKSVRSRVTTINEHAPEPITMEKFKEALKRHLLGDDVETYVLTEEEQAAVRRLRDEKYATWEWNYGHARAFDMVREEKFPAGLVTVHLSAKNGRIEDLEVSGDFFGNGDITELELALRGLPMDEKLAERIAALDLEQYMSGISPEQLAGLIRG